MAMAVVIFRCPRLHFHHGHDTRQMRFTKNVVCGELSRQNSYQIIIIRTAQGQLSSFARSFALFREDGHGALYIEA
jgi:hypothetical protein